MLRVVYCAENERSAFVEDQLNDCQHISEFASFSQYNDNQYLSRVVKRM
jgi:hypothetical protein